MNDDDNEPVCSYCFVCHKESDEKLVPATKASFPCGHYIYCDRHGEGRVGNYCPVSECGQKIESIKDINIFPFNTDESTPCGRCLWRGTDIDDDADNIKNFCLSNATYAHSCTETNLGLLFCADHAKFLGSNFFPVSPAKGWNNADLKCMFCQQGLYGTDLFRIIPYHQELSGLDDLQEDYEARLKKTEFSKKYSVISRYFEPSFWRNGFIPEDYGPGEFAQSPLETLQFAIYNRINIDIFRHTFSGIQNNINDDEVFKNEILLNKTRSARLPFLQRIHSDSQTLLHLAVVHRKHNDRILAFLCSVYKKYGLTLTDITEDGMNYTPLHYLFHVWMHEELRDSSILLHPVINILCTLSGINARDTLDRSALVIFIQFVDNALRNYEDQIDENAAFRRQNERLPAEITHSLKFTIDILKNQGADTNFSLHQYKLFFAKHYIEGLCEDTIILIWNDQMLKTFMAAHLNADGLFPYVDSIFASKNYIYGSKVDFNPIYDRDYLGFTADGSKIWLHSRFYNLETGYFEAPFLSLDYDMTALSPKDDLLLFSESPDDTDKLLVDINKRRIVGKLHTKNEDPDDPYYLGCTFSNDGNMIAFARGTKFFQSPTADKTKWNCVVVLSTKTGDVVGQFQGQNDDVDLVVFSPNNKHIVSGSLGLIILWNIETRVIEKELKVPNDSSFFTGDIVFSADGKSLCICSNNKEKQTYLVLLYDTVTYEITKTLDAHKDKVMYLDYSSDGMYLCSASLDGNVRIWDTKTWKCIRTIFCEELVPYKIRFSPDSKKICVLFCKREFMEKDNQGTFLRVYTVLEQ